MHINNTYFLATVAINNNFICAGSFEMGKIYSRKTHDGIIIIDARGDGIKIKTKDRNDENHVILHSYQELHGVPTVGIRKVGNKVLAERIISYINNYYGNRKTNCSAFAQYLKTGEFVECCNANNYFAYSGGMNRYTGQQVRPGDILCVLYYNKNAGSRKAPTWMRGHYMKAQKVKAKGANLDKLKSVRGGTCSAEELLAMYRSGYIGDYHFMFCIGVENGQPVFIQQLGWQDPNVSRDPRSSPILVTVGMSNFSPKNTPSYVFIKRGRD